MEENARRAIREIYESLQRLVGHHRRLLDIVRTERDALIQADIRVVEEITLAKRELIESIRQEESQRLARVADLAACEAWAGSRPEDLALTAIILAIQGEDLRTADQLRSVQTALGILAKRVSDQNRENQALVEKTLDHIQRMKRNVLGADPARPATYTQQGTRSTHPAGARLLSREA